MIWKYGRKKATLYILSKYDEAIECYENALRLNSNDVGLWVIKAIILDHLGKYDEAIKCFNEVLRINPNHNDAMKNMEMAVAESEKRKRFRFF